MDKQNFVFLGGTCGANRWREDIIIPALLEHGIALEQIFNPVVKDWNEEAQKREDEAKRIAQYMLYVIASPEPWESTANVSAYSLVELIMSLYDAPERTVALFDTTGMASHAAKAINKSAKDLKARFPQAPIFTDYATLIDWLVASLRTPTIKTLERHTDWLAHVHKPFSCKNMWETASTEAEAIAKLRAHNPELIDALVESE